jgi:hypothetical protein
MVTCVRTSALLAVAAFALVASGCGGRDGSADAAAGDAEREDAVLAYARCMRERGIDVPDPKPGALIELDDSVDPQRLDEARRACEQHLPGAEDVTPEEVEEFRDAMLAYARCMREHGIDVPDPDPDGFIEPEPGTPGFDGEDPLANPRFREANDACDDIILAGPSGRR